MGFIVVVQQSQSFDIFGFGSNSVPGEQHERIGFASAFVVVVLLLFLFSFVLCTKLSLVCSS